MKSDRQTALHRVGGTTELQTVCVERASSSSFFGLGLAGLRFFEQVAACVNIIDFVKDANGAVEPIIRVVNGTAGDLTRSISAEPALARFYRNYLAVQRCKVMPPQRAMTTVVHASQASEVSIPALSRLVSHLLWKTVGGLRVM